MIKIREGLFETNSSSTHNLTICTKKEYNDWKAGKLLYNYYDGIFIDNYLLSEEKRLARLKEYYITIKKSFYKDFEDLSEKEIQELYNKAIEAGFLFKNIEELDNSDSDCYTYYGFWNRDNDLEGFEEEYTTESGDEIVIFGEYGYQ